MGSVPIIEDSLVSAYEVRRPRTWLRCTQTVRAVSYTHLSADEPEQKAAAEKFIQKFGVRGPAYLKQAADDDHFINAIDPKWSAALAALFLYDKSGHKVRSFIGETDMAALEAAIRKLL